MDLNGDGKIGIKDLNMLLKGWNTTYTSNKDTLKNDIVTNWEDTTHGNHIHIVIFII